MSNLITLEHFHATAARYYIYERTESSIAQAPHYHDYFQVTYVIEGTIEHKQGADTATLQPGDIFIIPPGFVHRIHFTKPNTRILTLAFQDSLLLQDLPHSGASRFLKELQHNHDTGNISLLLTPDKNQQLSLCALLDCLLREQASACPPEYSATPSLICSVVYLLAQCYFRTAFPPRHPWSEHDQEQLLRRCVVYLDTHFTETISAEELAKQFGLSRSALSSAFPQHTGLPLHKYIAQKRIQKAQVLIRTHKDISLSEIAARVGYEDSSTFYRNFHRITGMSPAKYRELCQID